MNRWIRLASAVTAVATAIALSASGASASSVSPPAPSWNTPGSSIAQHSSAPAISPSAISAPSVSQTTFVPITPCRIADTRKGGGALVNLAVRTFFVQGTSNFAPQGGKSGGCGIPTTARSVVTNVTTTGATANGGYLSGYPAGSPEPLSNFVTYPAGTTTVNPTFTIATSTTNSLSIKAHGSNVQVIIDVTGYYTPQIEAIIAPDGSLYSKTSAIVASVRNTTGSYTITTAMDVSYCAVSIGIRGGFYYGDGYGSGTSISVSTWAFNSSGTGVATDLYYSIDVTC